ncbi:hypothetical protein JXQ70_04395 [bacterium]|nr:hypothetical protein [bacterium]
MSILKLMTVLYSSRLNGFDTTTIAIFDKRQLARIAHHRPLCRTIVHRSSQVEGFDVGREKAHVKRLSI